MSDTVEAPVAFGLGTNAAVFTDVDGDTLSVSPLTVDGNNVVRIVVEQNSMPNTNAVAEVHLSVAQVVHLKDVLTNAAFAAELVNTLTGRAGMPIAKEDAYSVG